MTFVYPRLPAEEVERLLAQERSALTPSADSELAAPAPNGTPASLHQLETVRNTVLDAVEDFGGQVPPAGVARWDAAVGAALHSSMEISASDASSDGVWAFLALVLMPDLALQRFPDGTEARLRGGQRNVFRRTWWRQHVLGDLATPDGVAPLGEDEMVNIFERSRLSRDHRLARAIATTILRHEGSGRSQFARDLSRHVRALTGPLVVELCPEEEVARIVEEAADIVRGHERAQPPTAIHQAP